MIDKTAQRRLGSVLQELTAMYSPTTLDVRADNAFGVAVRFFELITKMVPEPDDRKRLMSAWFKSVRDNDFRKFKRALRRYDKVRSGEPLDQDDAE